MYGSEPHHKDIGLFPTATGERDNSLHLFRRNSCQQERLNQDLVRLQRQEEQVMRKANREIIDLHIQQKKRKDALRNSRRQSECVGLKRSLLDLEVRKFLDNGSDSKTPRPQSRLSSATSNSTSSNESVGTAKTATRQRRSSVHSIPTLPDLPYIKVAPPICSTPDRPKSRSLEKLPSAIVSESASSTKEMFIDSKSNKEVSRLRKVSGRWQNAARRASVDDRSGKPLIPTNAFGNSTNNNETKRKLSDVFDRLSVDSRMTAMPADTFMKAVKRASSNRRKTESDPKA